jgi:nucleotidyltransferase substrate binding protein (TIGR01987 family)
MVLDLSPFQKALDSLGRAIKRAEASPADEELRDAVIQRFEYSYELSWKMLKRQLEQEVPNPAEVDRMSFRELLREGAERGMVEDPEQWMFYRQSRNITSHTYDEEKAKQVYESALDFYQDARELLSELEGR